MDVKDEAIKPKLPHFVILMKCSYTEAGREVQQSSVSAKCSLRMEQSFHTFFWGQESTVVSTAGSGDNPDMNVNFKTYKLCNL